MREESKTARKNIRLYNSLKRPRWKNPPVFLERVICVVSRSLEEHTR